VNPDNTAVDIGESEIDGVEASVEVAQIYNTGDPFSSGYRDVQRAILVKQNGAWKLSNMPAYNFWDYSWYQEVPK
jgi:outer membrane receptor for monomeric catechols